jgi:hypothetical protein
LKKANDFTLAKALNVNVKIKTNKGAAGNFFLINKANKWSCEIA